MKKVVKMRLEKLLLLFLKTRKIQQKTHNLKYELAFMMTRRSMHRQRTKKEKENLKYFPNIYSSYPTIFRISLWQYRLWIFPFDFLLKSEVLPTFYFPKKYLTFSLNIFILKKKSH